MLIYLNILFSTSFYKKYFLCFNYFELKKKLVINQGLHNIVIKIDFTQIFID